MKKFLLSAGLMLSMGTAAIAQNGAVVDTVVTGPGYNTNKWYSLSNGETASAPASDWDVSISTSTSMSGSLIGSIWFNHKKGTLYTIPGAAFSTFSAPDTTGMVANGPLYNSDSTWSKGAFNDAPSANQFDFIWGTYNMTTHMLSASRIYVIKYTTGEYYKVGFSMDPINKTYTVHYGELNSTPTDLVVNLNDYATKNFVYMDVKAGTLIDREPAKTNWDFYFSQYMGSLSPTMKYTVAGVLHNDGVEVAQLNNIGDIAAHNDHANAAYSSVISTIGYDWKNAGMNGVTIEDSMFFYVKSIEGEIWKVIFTGFVSGSANGNSAYIFSKEKVSTLSVDGIENDAFVAIYPNPANEQVQVVVDAKANTTVQVYNLMGALVYTQDVNQSGLQNVVVSTAELANGVYQVLCTSNGKTTAQKLIVQH